MFVETSVVVAILAREPDAGEFVSKIERAGTALTAGQIVLEGSMRLSTMLGVGPLEAEAAIHNMLAEADIEIVPITWEIAHEAVVAFDRFGKGRGHEAQFNFGDCRPMHAPATIMCRYSSKARISSRLILTASQR